MEANTIYPGPPDVIKLGHVVLACPIGTHHKMMNFMMKTFGFLPTDSVIFESPKSSEGHAINPKMYDALRAAGPSPLLFWYFC